MLVVNAARFLCCRHQAEEPVMHLVHGGQRAPRPQFAARGEDDGQAAAAHGLLDDVDCLVQTCRCLVGVPPADAGERQVAEDDDL
jgi:hypothetical protein